MLIASSIAVWVELTGFLATTRVRLQLTPNPPFLAMMTLTFLGKPKVTMSCVPIAKDFMNVMDIPGLNTFIQSSIDQAMAMYVAPRSLTLDLKEMLVGPDWKTDTEAVGVLVVTIKRAEEFKDGDGGKFWLGANGKSGDPYVTVGWGKWGKALWATRYVCFFPIFLFLLSAVCERREAPDCWESFRPPVLRLISSAHAAQGNRFPMPWAR